MVLNNSEDKIVKTLIQKGKELLEKPYEEIKFTKNPKADKFFNNINDFPHAFVLGCVMDRQIKAERAWVIPYEVSKEVNGFAFSKFLTLEQVQLKEIFQRKNLHRFNNTMAEYFYLAIQDIHNKYEDDASNIWKGSQKSATVVRRFLEFKGISTKIATMAANILAREFKIPFDEYMSIDISPDVHIKRVFKRLGLLSKNASNEELIYRARELNPLYPGIFDSSCWEIGRNWCNPRNPKCKDCYMNTFCLKIV